MRPILIPVLIFSILICGCETVKTYYVEKENIPLEEVVRIIGVFQKNGSFMDLKNKNAELIMNGKSIGINYDSANQKRANLPLDSIGILKIEIIKNNYWVPLYIIGGTVVLAFLYLIIFQPPIIGKM